MRIAVVDIGGTNIKSGMWEDDEIKEIRETPTDAKLGGGHVMETVLEILKGFQDFQAVGISTAGQVDTEKGMILYANDNIPGYTGTKIREIIEDMFHVPVAVLNDVNSAAAGEAFYGVGKDQKDFLCLTYGTGVGGAIVINGEVYNGSGYSAGEFGGIVTHPEDREPDQDMFSGCYEKYASTTALVKRAGEQFPELKSGRDIFARIEEPEVRDLIDKWILEIVYGLTTLVHIFNPSMIVLGGGIMEQEYVVSKVREKLGEHIMSSFQNVKVVSAQLGNMAGMLGAAREAKKEFEKGKKKS